MTLDEFDALVGQDSYVRCNGKIRIDSAIVDLKTAKRHIQAGGQIGWWVRSGYLVVDIDEGAPEALKAAKFFNLKTLMCRTVKGLHLYFRTDEVFQQKIKMVSPFGLICDYRCANKGYVLLPFNSPGRSFNRVRSLAELTPEFTALPGRKESLLGLRDGEGRNSTLFSHLMSLKNRSYTQEQIDALAACIDAHVFGEPMGAKELKKILASVERYEADDKGENPYLIYGARGGVKINARAICDYFVNQGDIFVLGGECYQYRDGVYREASAYIRSLIKEMIGIDTLIDYYSVMEVYKLIADDVRLIRHSHEINANPELINFRNGVYDTRAQKRISHDSKYLQTIQIPHDISVFGRTPLENTLLYKYLSEKCELATDDIDMILSYMAYCLTFDYGLKTFMILLGPTNTGKSVLIRFFNELLGPENVSALSIHELNMRFYPAQIYNKLMNACADNSALPLSAIENLKKITGGDQIMHERKGRDPFFFTPFAKLIFSFNQMPLQLEEKSNAFYRRMRILRMDKELRLDDAYVSRLCSEHAIEQILPHLVQRLPLREIPATASSKKAVELVRRDSDSIHDFITKFCVQAADEYARKDELYGAYTRFCIDAGREAHKKHGFQRHMRSLGYTEIRKGATREPYWKGLTLK